MWKLCRCMSSTGKGISNVNADKEIERQMENWEYALNNITYKDRFNE